MRQLRRESQKVSTTLDLTPFALQDLSDFLDSPKALHIETIYFTADGSYWLNCFEWEGKMYSRLDFETVSIGQAPNVKWIRKRVGREQNLIVKALDAGEIIDLVEDWKQNFAIQQEIIDPSDKNTHLDEKLRAKKIIWVNDESKMEKSEELTTRLINAEKPLKKLSKKEIIELQNKK